MERLTLAVCVALSIYGPVEGVNYVVALMGHQATYIEYKFILTNTYNESITITANGTRNQELGNVTIPSQGGKDKLTYSFTQMQALNSSEVANKSIIVSSVPENSTFTLQVFVIRTDTKYVEGFMGIPIENLAGPVPTSDFYEYRVVTFCATGGYCQFAIAAYNESAGIYITFPEKAESIVFCIGKTYFRSKRDTEIKLQPFDAVQFETTSDLTGTHIYSKQPIVVFVGSHNVSYNGSIVAHTVEQLPASSHWGMKYAVRTLGTNGYGDILKISSNWNNTKVIMKGFPTFVINDTKHTVTRRLDKDMVSFINASHPIQVVQITGLPYTSEEPMKLGMTVVPAIEHFQPNFWVSCDDDAEFHLVSKKLTEQRSNINRTTRSNHSVQHDFNGKTYTAYESDFNGIEYTDYTTGTFTNKNSSTKPIVVYYHGFDGIVKCSTAVMPLGTYHAKIENPPTNSTLKRGYCRESQTATTTYTAGVSTQLVPHMVSLTDTDDILKLRVLNCGQAAVQFYEKNDATNNSILIILSRKHISVTECYPTCNVSRRHDDTYNNADTTLDCKTDMNFYWFRLFNTTNGTQFCLGVGPFPDKTENCSKTGLDSFAIPNRFVRVSMIGMFTTASFNYDLQPYNGCSSYNEDTWRCVDNIATCPIYGKDMCNNNIYKGFVMAHCRKYCQKCKVDSFGNNFRVVIPRKRIGDVSCSFYVSAIGDIGNVAVGNVDVGSINGKVIKASQHGATRSYPCVFDSEKCEVYFIVADMSVSVTVVYSVGNKINSYPVYPVDAFGTVFMTIIHSPKDTHCCFLSEDADVSVTPYYKAVKTVGYPPTGSSDTESFSVKGTSSTPYEISNGDALQGALFIADGMVTVFCGLRVLHIQPFHYDNHFNQMLPLDSWGTRYMVPTFSRSTASRPFDAKLIMLASTDNTNISIDGDFNSTYNTLFRGSTKEASINASAVHSITSNYPIAVGLFLYNTVDTSISSFHVLPSTPGFLKEYILGVAPDVLNSTHNFDVNDVTAYHVMSDGTSDNTTVACTPKCSLIPNSSATGQYSMAVILGNYNRWLVIPGQTGMVSYAEKTPCATSDLVVGDRFDNDCDGLIDEDVCYTGYGVYAEDYDLDGDFGDDCHSNKTEPSIVSKPDEPQCIEINKTDGYCWTVCSCKCSWVKKLEEYKAMTDEQKAAFSMADIERYKSALHINTSNLTSRKSRRLSARDKRQSAANIGYFGIGLFTLVFVIVLILDMAALIRDARTTIANLREGFRRLRRFIGRAC